MIDCTWILLREDIEHSITQYYNFGISLLDGLYVNTITEKYQTLYIIQYYHFGNSIHVIDCTWILLLDNKCIGKYRNLIMSYQTDIIYGIDDTKHLWLFRTRIRLYYIHVDTNNNILKLHHMLTYFPTVNLKGYNWSYLVKNKTLLFDMNCVVIKILPYRLQPKFYRNTNLPLMMEIE